MLELIKILREKTGVGFLDCKVALEQTEQNLEEAIEYLRIKGILKSEVKMSRNTDQGIVYSYIHHDKKIGVMIELNCETDFVAMNSDFKNLAHNLCLHIAANRPRYLAKEDVPVLYESREKEMNRLKAVEEGRPENLIDKIVLGRMQKFYQSICLLEQSYLMDEALTISDFLKSQISKFGENIKIKQFALFIIGEEQIKKTASEQFFN